MQKRFHGMMLIALLLVMSVAVLPASAQTEACQQIGQMTEWDGQSPFNLLVLGMDRRPGARDNLNARTDAIMVVRYDPRTGALGVLDIPRDLHFAVMNMNESLLRVNTLMVEGESLAEGCGPYFAMQTFQLNLGMYIDAYIAFDFVGFIEFVDALGGVTVDVPYPISDSTFPDMNYGYDPLYLSAGVQQMDGRTALKYARTRHGDNDYERGLRQLQVVMAVKDRASDPAALQALIGNLPALIGILDGHFYSNMSVDQLVTLGVSIVGQDLTRINTESLGLDYSYTYTYRGLNVRVPDRAKLVDLLVAVFGADYWY